MFLVNSRSHLVFSTTLRSICSYFTIRGVPSPEVTVPFCLVPSPEFSQAPEYSLLVYLCRFAVRISNMYCLETFPGSLAFATSVSFRKHRHYVLRLLSVRICLNTLSTRLNRDFQHPASIAFFVLPSHISLSTGFLTCHPSTTPFGLALGSDLPCVDLRCAGTLRLPAW